MRIDELARQHNELMEIILRNAESPRTKALEELYSSNFSMTANGEVLVDRPNQLSEHYAEWRTAADDFNIMVGEMLPSLDNKSCTIRYTVATKQVGSYEILAILRSSNGLQIESLEEFYYEIKS